MPDTGDVDVTDLRYLFELQRSLIAHYKAAGFDHAHDGPVDVESHEGQVVCRNTALKAVEEFFEAIQLLKNWKPHRRNRNYTFDRPAFVEELVDAFHYIFELCILVDISPEELAQAYISKNEVNHRRIDEGY